jgi:hypothetical protein
MILFHRPNPLAFQLGFDAPMFDVLPEVSSASILVGVWGKRYNVLTFAIQGMALAFSQNLKAVFEVLDKIAQCRQHTSSTSTQGTHAWIEG